MGPQPPHTGWRGYASANSSCRAASLFTVASQAVSRRAARVPPAGPRIAAPASRRRQRGRLARLGAGQGGDHAACHCAADEHSPRHGKPAIVAIHGAEETAARVPAPGTRTAAALRLRDGTEAVAEPERGDRDPRDPGQNREEVKQRRHAGQDRAYAHEPTFMATLGGGDATMRDDERLPIGRRCGRRRRMRRRQHGVEPRAPRRRARRAAGARRPRVRRHGPLERDCTNALHA